MLVNQRLKVVLKNVIDNDKSHCAIIELPKGAEQN